MIEDIEDPREALSRIFDKLCRAMEKRLDDGDVSAAEMNAIQNLLKHNGISALPVKGKPLGDLANKAAEYDFPFAPPGGSLLDEDDPAVKGAVEGS